MQHCNAFYTAITQGPQLVNATFGNTATFTCIGQGNILKWIIDGIDVNLMSPALIQLRGIQVASTKTLIYIDIGYYPKIYSYGSSLNIAANCINNYTTIQCLIHTCSNIHTANTSLQVEGIILYDYYLVIFSRSCNFAAIKYHN